ncbi:MAG: peptidoglycan DD-metalloendopeptidase family protein [Saccharospirillaceae bacterium]|nr:peptidoglycan DD-metalloendopeptidase family protein [Pseudomonadales bacterium]NRB79788.1 peptidoglycan DD-metalloendopeptidase family protein [Saccharospirillaceae bacterium]
MRKKNSKNSSKNWRTNSAHVAICSCVYLLLQSCINMPAYHSLDDPFKARQWYANTHGLDKPVIKEIEVVPNTSNQATIINKPNQLNLEVDNNQQYTVKKSDTLFSIAYRFEIDYRKLASANHIKSPFIIFPGQILDLNAANLIEDSQVDIDITVVNLPTDFIAPIEVITTAKVEQTIKPIIASKPVVSINTPSKNNSSQNTVKKPTPPKTPAKETSGWFWPSNGNIVRTFSTTNDINKGIDIKGVKGESVLAAATGTIVFVGAGPLGYGQLLIVQHDNQWLSAYSNLEKIVVKEKQIVKASEVIAEIGNDRSGNSILHFEIRRLGKPVDPMLYLPKLE